MEKSMAPASGVARAKYMRDFTRKINNLNDPNLCDIFDAKLQLKPKLPDMCKNKKRKLQTKLSVKLQQKDINQEYIVQRMKFLRQNIDTVNEAVNRNFKKYPAFRVQSKFEQLKNKSFEMEKQKLYELYKANVHNLKIAPTQELKSEVKLQSPQLKVQEHPVSVEKNIPPRPVHALINNPVTEIILKDLQSVDCKQESQVEQSNRTIPVTKPRDANEDLVVQLCQNQSQNIDVNNNSNALVPSNNIVPSRRVCHRNKRFKRYLVKQFCAHCHDLITDVAYFSGTQQLCFECADRHYERVSRARYRDRPMGYREFKNIGGDTIYNKN